MSGFRLVLNRAWFGGGSETPCIKEDGDEHVAHARAGSGDDPIHRHDEWNGRDDDLIRQARGCEDERQHDQPCFRNAGYAGPLDDRLDLARRTVIL